MSELCSTEEMIERIKDIISPKIGERKVFDYDVAMVLHISHMTLATHKKRGSKPYKAVVLFCDRWGVNPLDVLLKRYESC